MKHNNIDNDDDGLTVWIQSVEVGSTVEVTLGLIWMLVVGWYSSPESKWVLRSFLQNFWLVVMISDVIPDTDYIVSRFLIVCSLWIVVIWSNTTRISTHWSWWYPVCFRSKATWCNFPDKKLSNYWEIRGVWMRGVDGFSSWAVMKSVAQE